MKSITLLTLFSLLAITSLTTSISSCNKSDYPTPKDTIRADPEFLEWWWCKEGSWWVYKRIDDTTQEMYDTATVTLQTSTISFEPRFSPSAIATYFLHLEHSSQYFKQRGSLNDQILNTSGTNANGLISDSHGSGNYFLFKWILNWPLKYEFNIQDPNGVTMLDSNRLANPILNKPTLNYTTGWKDGEVWVSKNIGVIKYNFRDSSVWELIDYHVIQN